MQEPPDQRCKDLIEALGLGKAEEVTAVTPLTGGVASDIARVALGGRVYCVKFALAKLRVAADWYAPVHRSRAEYAWLQAASRIVPQAVPQLFGSSDSLGGFAMEYLAGPDIHLWKTLLLSEAAPAGEAARVADTLGRIHAAAALPGFDRSAFKTQSDFHALRTEPYLLFTAVRYPELAADLHLLAASLDRPVTLVHGDVSPKNILLRAGQPILLDAECATLGDPAFDVAFCLNHLALKSLHLPTLRRALLDEIARFWAAYAPHVAWEPPAAIQQRIAALVPGLMLARVDGKSPVEYLTERQRDTVRALAIPMIRQPPETLVALAARLAQETG